MAAKSFVRAFLGRHAVLSIAECNVSIARLSECVCECVCVSVSVCLCVCICVCHEICCLITCMKKLLDSDWLREVQFKSNTSAKSVIPVQKA